MKKLAVLAFIMPSLCLAQAPQFSIEQTKACSALAEDVVTFNEMRKDGLPLEEAKNIFKQVPSRSEFSQKMLEELYNYKENNGFVLYGYFEVGCYNKIANKAHPSFKTIRPKLSECEKSTAGKEVMECVVEKTVELTFKENNK
jgi:hypothetical protein